MRPTQSDLPSQLPAAERLMTHESPKEIRVTDDGAGLKLTWHDNRETFFSAPFLRDSSQSARSKKLRLSGLEVPASQDLKISALRPIGAYAINVVFSDGYDRGIYPWAYLHDLAGTVQVSGKQRTLTPEDFLKGN